MTKPPSIDSAMQSIAHHLSAFDEVLGSIHVDQLNPSERVRCLQIMQKLHDVKEDIEILLKPRNI